MSDAVITTHDLRKSFRSSRKPPVEAVRGVSMEVRRGEIFGFLGPNGAGKTTTLRMLTTLLPFDSGTATVAGVDVLAAPHEVRKRIGYVSQLGGSDELATGRENLVLQGRLYGDDAATVRTRSDALIELLELSAFADRRVITYSGGQRRRLDVALGIVHAPEILFLDEPSTGLDPQNRANLWSQIAGLRERGTTIFLTTHYLEEADELCDRLMIMDHGQIVAEGSPRELKREIAGDTVVLSVHEHERQAPRAAEHLRDQPYVRELTNDETAMRLYVDEGGSAIVDILRVLDREGIAIQSITVAETSLDDVFLRKTGRSLRDAGPNADSSQAEGQ